METAIQKMTVLSLFIIGLSHALEPRAWVEFFLLLRSKGKVGIFFVGFLHLPLGLLIVSFHNVWSGLPMVITLIGCAWTLKGLLYFCFPKVGMWGLSRVSLERTNEFRVPGAIFMLLSCWLGYGLWR